MYHVLVEYLMHQECRERVLENVSREEIINILESGDTNIMYKILKIIKGIYTIRNLILE